MPASPTILTQLETALAEARAALTQAAGGQAVCAIHKFGTPSEALKYNEGKEFVLRDVLRLLRKDAADADVAALLAEHARTFTGYRTSAVTTTPLWQAYALGGLDGVTFARAVLGIADPHGAPTTRPD